MKTSCTDSFNVVLMKAKGIVQWYAKANYIFNNISTIIEIILLFFLFHVMLFIFLWKPKFKYNMYT